VAIPARVPRAMIVSLCWFVMRILASNGDRGHRLREVVPFYELLIRHQKQVQIVVKVWFSPLLLAGLEPLAFESVR
jgi:hypothetical protein